MKDCSDHPLVVEAIETIATCIYNDAARTAEENGTSLQDVYAVDLDSVAQVAHLIVQSVQLKINTKVS